MKRFALPLACVLPLALASCTMPQMAAVGTRAALSPETVSTLNSICRHGEQLIAIAASPAMPAQVKEIGAFVGSYCSQLLAGSVPPTTDGNTAGWLAQNLGALRGLLFKP
jgi:hypothetical protein